MRADARRNRRAIVEAAIELAEENLDDSEGMSGTGVVITGSVMTAGAARTLFGKDPA